MPELPDLEVIKEVLQRRVVGRRITSVEIPRPLVLRVLDPGASAEELLRRRLLANIERRGKFLLLQTDKAPWIVVNFMLAGHFRLCPSRERKRTRDYVLFHLDDGSDLRYNDTRGMGKIYITTDQLRVPGLAEMGPDALAPDLTREVFLARLKRCRGETKGILTRGACVAGIGNAYADEILFQAGIYPFRNRPSLSIEEQTALYDAMRQVLGESIALLRERMGDSIHQKVRDFMLVHNRKGQPCPKCGRPISEVRAAQRATNFCRHCQPGSMISN